MIFPIAILQNYIYLFFASFYEKKSAKIWILTVEAKTVKTKILMEFRKGLYSTILCDYFVALLPWLQMDFDFDNSTSVPITIALECSSHRKKIQVNSSSGVWIKCDCSWNEIVKNLNA